MKGSKQGRPWRVGGMGKWQTENVERRDPFISLELGPWHQAGGNKGAFVKPFLLLLLHQQQEDSRVERFSNFLRCSKMDTFLPIRYIFRS